MKIKDTTDESIKDWVFYHLFDAAYNGETETVKMLCETGAQVDNKMFSYDHKTPLQVAIENGHSSTAQYLIKEAKADVNIADAHSDPAFHLAVGRGSLQMVKLLCEAGAQVSGRNRNGHTVLQCAIEQGHSSIAEYLIKEAKADMNLVREEGNTLLHLAAINGNTETVDVLLNEGVSIESKGFDGRTALHEASRHCHLSTVECLIRRGACVNQQSESGWTPLHDAGYKGHTAIFSLLLKSGADASIKNYHGITAREVSSLNCRSKQKRQKMRAFWDQLDQSGQ